MKKAVNLEKAIFRHRIHVIKDMAQYRLKEMRKKAKNLYNNLEDWTNYNFSIEIEVKFLTFSTYFSRLLSKWI